MNGDCWFCTGTDTRRSDRRIPTPDGNPFCDACRANLSGLLVSLGREPLPDRRARLSSAR